MALADNKVKIRTLLNKINNLPNAGDGTPEDLEAVLAEQENLIATLQDTLRGKGSLGGQCTLRLKVVGNSEIGSPLDEPPKIGTVDYFSNGKAIYNYFYGDNDDVLEFENVDVGMPVVCYAWHDVGTFGAEDVVNAAGIINDTDASALVFMCTKANEITEMTVKTKW